MNTDARNDPDSLLVYGEVLFDLFDDGQEVLGGAPFNVAWHLALEIIVFLNIRDNLKKCMGVKL